MADVHLAPDHLDRRGALECGLDLAETTQTKIDTAGGFFDRPWGTRHNSVRNVLCANIQYSRSATHVMSRVWVTTSSTTLEAMINPLSAACEQGYVPTSLHYLTNPGVDEAVTTAIELGEVIISEYGGTDPTIHLEEIDDDTDFTRIHSHVRDAITAAQETGDEVAVDITPGRKYMSAIAFATGLRYEADHVFYFYLHSTDYHDACYAEMPRSATKLYDFTEVL